MDLYDSAPIHKRLAIIASLCTNASGLLDSGHMKELREEIAAMGATVRTVEELVSKLD